MKYSNLIDAVTGKIYEGKSYKKNDDEDTKSKKEKDQERKEAGKNKKQPVEEGKSFKRNDDDDKDADDKKKEDKQKRDAKKQPVGEAMGDGMTDAAKIKNLRGLIKKCKEAAIEHSDRPAKSAQYEKQVAKYEKELAELKSKKPVSESVFTEDEDHANSLSEAYGRGWAILPATVALYNKKVVDITTAASEWASDKYPTSILVCHKNENGRDRMLFLSSSGDCRNQYKVGQSSETYHDQTGASKGIYTVLNIVVFQSGEMIYKANEEGLNKKASVAVFK
jgi:hypothetical protein